MSLDLINTILPPPGMGSEDVKFFRQEMDWTQKEMAERIGVSLKAVAFWEQGRRPVPVWLSAVCLLTLTVNKFEED